MSWQSILRVIYSFPSCFCSQFDLLERNFRSRYPIVSLVFSFKKYCFWPLRPIFSTYWSFFSESVAKSIWELFILLLFLLFEISILFCWLFFWFKQWEQFEILGSFGTFLALYWRFLSEWLAKSIWEQFLHNVYFLLVNLTYWRANFEVAIVFCDFSLGSKKDSLGSFGRFPAQIRGFFLNELANHFRSSWIFFFLFLRSI